MSYRIVHGDEIGHWVATEIGGMYASSQAQAIGLERHGRIEAGIIFEDWNGRSLAARGRLTRTFLQVITNYAFEQCQVSKVIAPVFSNNPDGIRFVKKMGFIEECRIKEAQPNGDILIFTLVKSECRYLKHG